MATAPASRFWMPVDIDSICKPWEVDKFGTYFRQKNAARAVRALANTINHLCLTAGAHVIFQQAVEMGARATAGADPLFVWRYNDRVKNATTQAWRMIMVPRTAGTGSAYAQRQGDTTKKTVQSAYVAPSATWPGDIYLDGFDLNPTITDALRNEGISTFNNAQILDVCIQDEPVPSLDIAIHDYCQPGGAVMGYPVIANMIEQMRSAFANVRAKYLPVIASWSAARGSGGWASPASSDTTGLVATSTTLTNLLDGTSTTRTADTRGWTAELSRCGRGPISATDGTKVPTLWSVYADYVGGVSTGTVRIIGPDHVATNWQDIASIATGGPAWYDLSTATSVYGNSGVDVTSVATARNKFDVHGQLGNAGDTKLLVYAVDGRVMLEL